MLVNMEDSYETKSGLKVVILTIDAPGDCPIIGYYVYGTKTFPGKWDKTGVFYLDRCDEYNLIRVNTKKISYLVCANITLLDDTKEHVKLIFKFQIKTEATRQDDIKREAEEYGSSMFTTLHSGVNFNIKIVSVIKL